VWELEALVSVWELEALVLVWEQVVPVLAQEAQGWVMEREEPELELVWVFHIRLKYQNPIPNKGRMVLVSVHTFQLLKLFGLNRDKYQNLGLFHKINNWMITLLINTNWYYCNILLTH
jgi:hypothetical protein